MALRAVSIVGLESSIRAQFDRQIDEIQRNLQAQHRARSRRGSRARDNSGQREQENGEEAQEQQHQSSRRGSRDQRARRNSGQREHGTPGDPRAQQRQDHSRRGSRARVNSPQRVHDNGVELQVQHEESSRRGSQERANSPQGVDENSETIPRQSGDEESHANPEASSHSSEESPDMAGDGDLGRSTTLQLPTHNNNSTPGRSTAPGTRANSVDIRVEYDAFPESQNQQEPSENGDSIDETLEREIRGLSGGRDRNMTCCQFYRNHWMGHLVTGVLTACLFVLLGIIFLVNGSDTIPIYAGIILIILGLAPCCMALNRYRYARLYERERHRAIQRLGALRRAHRRHAREERRRLRQEYSDLPPSYDNLGFDLGDEDLDDHDTDDDDLSNITFSSNGSFVLPTYDQCVKNKKQTSDKKSNTIEGIGEDSSVHDESPNVNNNNNNNANSDDPPNEDEAPLGNDEVMIVVEPPEDDEPFETVEADDTDQSLDSGASASGDEHDQSSTVTVVNEQIQNAGSGNVSDA